MFFYILLSLTCFGFFNFGFKVLAEQGIKPYHITQCVSTGVQLRLFHGATFVLHLLYYSIKHSFYIADTDFGRHLLVIIG